MLAEAQFFSQVKKTTTKKAQSELASVEIETVTTNAHKGMSLGQKKKLTFAFETARQKKLPRPEAFSEWN